MTREREEEKHANKGINEAKSHTINQCSYIQKFILIFLYEFEEFSISFFQKNIQYHHY
jgi:hypothetical protein